MLLSNLGGFGESFDKEAFFKLPEMKDILLYHILPGAYTSDYLKNNTALITAKAIEVTPMRDPLTIGRIIIREHTVECVFARGQVDVARFVYRQAYA